MAATTEKPVSTASATTATTTPASVTSSAKLLVEPKPKKTVDSALPSTDVKDSDVLKTTGTTVGSVARDSSGPVNDIQKKILRAERFGVPVQLSEQEKRNSRAERFGLAVPTTAADEEAKRKARLARFAPYSKPDSVEEEKRTARAIRFSNPQSSSLREVNGKGNIGSGAPIAGKAAGAL